MQRATLLVVTNDAALAQEVLACVERLACPARVRTHVDEALDDLGRMTTISLVLCDDPATVAQMRTHPRATDLPALVVFPADASDETLAAALDAGADACLPRPLRCATVRAWMHMAVRLHNLHGSLHDAARGTVDRVSEPLLRSAGLAHAVSRPLQNIAAAVDLMEMSLPNGFDEMEQVESIRRNVQRAAEIVRGASEEARLALRRVNGDA